MDEQIKITLKELGLTEGEIRVYISLVELGSTTVGAIIDKAQISSSKVYIILEKLIQKGLSTYIIKNKTKYFQATSPISLLNYANKREKQIQETKKSLNQVIEKIEKIKNRGVKSEEAKIYKGYEGIKTALFEAIKSIPDGGGYYFFSTGYGQDPYLQTLFMKIAFELKRRKIILKGLGSKEEKKLYEKHYNKLGYKMRYVDYFWPSDTSIIGDYLIIFVWDKKEPVIYSIQSPTLVKSYLNFFNLHWKMAKP